MKRGRKKKATTKAPSLNLKGDAIKSIIAVILLAISVVSIISFFAPDYKINARIYEFWKYIFGMGAIIGPVFLFIFSTFLIETFSTKLKEPRILIGALLLFASVLGFFHIFIPQEDAYKASVTGKGGGYVGYVISSVLSNSLSVPGGVIVLIGVSVISVMIIFNITLDQILAFLHGVFAPLKLFSGFKRNKSTSANSDEDDLDTEVSSGVPMEDEDFEEVEEPIPEISPAALIAKEVSKKQDKAGSEFSLEVLPSPSEPQGELIQRPLPNINIDPSKLSVPVPYADKVWETPPLTLLSDGDSSQADSGDTEARERKIKETLRSFDIDVSIEEVKSGPTFTQYALKVESGVKISKITTLEKDIAMALSSPSGTVRIEAPIPGKSWIGIEVPNNKRASVSFKSLITSDAIKSEKSKLAVVMGKDVAGRVVTYDIARMPHMLIAGTTGSGKSVFLHNSVFSMLYRASPQDVKFIFIDPKRVEFARYEGIPHLLAPIVTDVSRAPAILKWAVDEMDRRYKVLQRAHAINISSYNENSGFQALPYIVIIVDELADIMIQDKNGVEKSIIRIAQLARAVGIHLILALQRPTTDVITGLIKANIPCRVSFNVTSRVDSQVIIDQPGAERLLGRGDMLFVPPDDSKARRLQGAFVSEKEMANLTNYLRSKGAPIYVPEILELNERPSTSGSGASDPDEDPLFNEAVELVVVSKKASASMLQTKLSIGFARAARIIEHMEQKGIIGPANGQKPREILVKDIPSKDSRYDDFDPQPIKSFDSLPALNEFPEPFPNQMDNAIPEVEDESPDSINSIS